ncbi:MAG: hypothetical protein JOZ13_10810 [Alphaproteobacteria bacterium]|nr:hypothetical protein [Alphaproteobacteria bacterium]
MRSQILTMCLAAATFACLARPAEASPAIISVKPMFVTLPNNHAKIAPGHVPAGQLVQWSGSFTDLTGHHVSYVMPGTNPATTNTATTIPVYIVPIKMVYGALNGNMTFDPVAHILSNGRNIVQNTTSSPLFTSDVNFTQGGVNLGTTQYIDAFQRGNFWSSVSTNSGYHVLLGAPTVLAEQTINVSAVQGRVMNNPFGSGKVGTMGINAFDTKLQGFITALTQINPAALPLFITYDIYLTQTGQCCIGGYHSAIGANPGGQTYSYSTYVDTVGAFSQDVSAISHELGEWMDDPFVNNAVNCTDNSIMEVGDPLEGRANYGGYHYTDNGFTYNVQSLVFIGYFGAPRSTSVNSWLSFQNDEANVCPGQ